MQSPMNNITLKPENKIISKTLVSINENKLESKLANKLGKWKFEFLDKKNTDIYIKIWKNIIHNSKSLENLRNNFLNGYAVEVEKWNIPIYNTVQELLWDVDEWYTNVTSSRHDKLMSSVNKLNRFELGLNEYIHFLEKNLGIKENPNVSKSSILVNIDTLEIEINVTEEEILDKAWSSHIVISDQNLEDILLFDKETQIIIKKFITNNRVLDESELEKLNLIKD